MNKSRPTRHQTSEVHRPTAVLKGITNRAINPLNAELNSICHLLALLGAHHILHVSAIRVKCFFFMARKSVAGEGLLVVETV